MLRIPIRHSVLVQLLPVVQALVGIALTKLTLRSRKLLRRYEVNSDSWLGPEDGLVSLLSNVVDKTIAPDIRTKLLVGARMLLTVLAFVVPVALLTFTESYIKYDEKEIQWKKVGEKFTNITKYQDNGYF